MINFPTDPFDGQTLVVGQYTYTWSADRQSWSAIRSLLNADFITNNRVVIRNETVSVDTATGALVVAGGVGIGGDLYVGGEIWSGGFKVITTNDYTPGQGVSIGSILGGTGTEVTITPQGVATIWSSMDLQKVTDLGSTTTNSVNIDNTTSSTDPTTGALTVTGGAGVGGDLWVGGVLHATVSGSINTATNLLGGATGSIPYQSSSGVTDYIGIGSSGTVLISNGTTASWIDVGDLNTTISPYAGIFTITNTTSATSTVSGALQISGGVGVGGDLWIQGYAYSENGRPLYTPSVTVGVAPNVNPRVGDFWIDSNAGIEYQYIQDGTSTFWIQFVGF